jgi:hypothetical protein
MSNYKRYEKKVNALLCSRRNIDFTIYRKTCSAYIEVLESAWKKDRQITIADFFVLKDKLEKSMIGDYE